MRCLVKTKSETLLFFYDEKRGLCYQSEMDGEKINILTEQAQGEFDVYADDALHLVCQSRQGELYYFCYRMGQWHRRLILNSKKGEPAARCLRLWGNEKEYKLFYVLEYGGDYLLICQPLESGRPQPLAKLDRPSFLLRTDPAGCLYLIYEREGEAASQCYRYGNWTPPVTIGEYQVEDALYTQTQTAHLAVSRGGSLFYLSFEDGEVKETIPITRSGQTRPVLLFYENSLWMLYEERGRIFYWKKGERVPVAMITGTQPELFHLRFYQGTERETARRAYGCRVRGKINLFIASKIPEAKQQSFPDDCRIQITKLKLRLDSLEQSVRQLQKDLLRCQTKERLSYSHQPSKEENLRPPQGKDQRQSYSPQQETASHPCQQTRQSEPSPPSSGDMGVESQELDPAGKNSSSEPLRE